MTNLKSGEFEGNAILKLKQLEESCPASNDSHHGLSPCPLSMRQLPEGLDFWVVSDHPILA
jgi:hypothetical protein